MIAMDEAWKVIKFQAFAPYAQNAENDPRHPVEWLDPDQSSTMAGAGAGALGSLRARLGPRWSKNEAGEKTWLPQFGDPAIHQQMNASKTAQNQMRADMRDYNAKLDRWTAQGRVGDPPEKPVVSMGPGTMPVESLLQQPPTGKKPRDVNRLMFGHAAGKPFSELKNPPSKASQIRMQPGPILPRPILGPNSLAEAAKERIADRWYGGQDKKASKDSAWRLTQLSRLKEAQGGFLHPRQQKQYAAALTSMSNDDPIAADAWAKQHGYSTAGQRDEQKRADILEMERLMRDKRRDEAAEGTAEDPPKEEEEEIEDPDSEEAAEDDPICERCGRPQHTGEGFTHKECTWKKHLDGSDLSDVHPLGGDKGRRRELDDEKFDIDAPHWLEGSKRPPKKGASPDYQHHSVPYVRGNMLMRHLEKIHPEKFLGAALPYKGTWKDYVMKEIFQNPKVGSEHWRYARRLGTYMTSKTHKNKLLTTLHGKSIKGKASDFLPEPTVSDPEIKGTSMVEAMKEHEMRRRGVNSAKAGEETEAEKTEVKETKGKCERCKRDWHHEVCSFKNDVDGKKIGKSFDTVDPLVAAWDLLKAR